MIEFGSSLRRAREAKGYSVAQIADLTRMAPRTVQELESENFSHIAAPIYGRGFVKLYCEAVGLDPRPFIDEFMAIYNGVHDVGIKERPPPRLPGSRRPRRLSNRRPRSPPGRCRRQPRSRRPCRWNLQICPPMMQASAHRPRSRRPLRCRAMPRRCGRRSPTLRPSPLPYGA